MHEIDGKWLAFLLIGQSAAVGADQEVVVFAGMARRAAEGEFFLDRGPDYKKIDLRAEWLPRIMPVPPAKRTLVHNADFVLTLLVDALPGTEDLETYVQARFIDPAPGC
jgi:hypothetical protein